MFLLIIVLDFYIFEEHVTLPVAWFSFYKVCCTFPLSGLLLSIDKSSINHVLVDMLIYIFLHQNLKSYLFYYLSKFGGREG
ncbi:hypothetical protein ACS0TY_002503 [Phlomoides rotata]